MKSAADLAEKQLGTKKEKSPENLPLVFYFLKGN